jgi:hypothetical protein
LSTFPRTRTPRTPRTPRTLRKLRAFGTSGKFRETSAVFAFATEPA